MKDLGFGQGQKWEAGFHHEKSYLPASAQGLAPFYQPKKP